VFKFSLQILSEIFIILRRIYTDIVPTLHESSCIVSLPYNRYEGPKAEQSYSCTLSLTSALDGVGGQRHAPAALPLGKIWYPLCRRLGGP